MENNGISNSDTLIDQCAIGPCNNTISSVLSRIGLATVVYQIWKERNARLFTGAVTDKERLLKIIEGNIKMQLRSLKVKKSAQVLSVAQRWNIEMNIVQK